MGKLINGDWVDGSIIKSDESGSFDRPDRSFRSSIAKDHDRFQPQSGRYHLYVSYACPWAHRTLIMRKLKNLENHIDVSVVHPLMLEKGWTFNQDFAGATGDKLYDLQFLHQLYQKADPKVSTTVTVPVLWDRETESIVNNESSEIIRIFNSAFNEITGNTDDYYPDNLKEQIDRFNTKIYEHINNGVYKAGFAKNQKSYDEAVKLLFDCLTELEVHLDKKPFLMGETATEADVRLLTTLLRFDLVYNVHFKCSYKKIAEYPNLLRYMASLYKWSSVKETTFFDHIKHHYYCSHKEINPMGLIANTKSGLENL